MRVLGLDTTLGACSVGIIDGDRLLARRFEPMARGHAEALMPMVEAARREAGLDFADLDLLAATVGPGTFTGVRVGLAAARGLALASGLPLAGVTTLEAIAASVTAPPPDAASILVAIDARRAELYCQAFTLDRTPLTEPRVVAPARAADDLPDGVPLVVGSGAALVQRAVERPVALVQDGAAVEPDAAVVARIAAGRGLPPSDAPPVEPLYLRAPDAVPMAARREQ
ncbi:MAG: tRNA (adenosine(37)-N6)-threonylcarbamoyltransferase complex dimerization subunit type 1 TsaB [Minwuiales bacterium]|nr:tRNA (adenosine(37)-N6)-threonylcarbamoyltransferase complex dimerization subunit type 1 TsaB [Minwuiales bacterium]